MARKPSSAGILISTAGTAAAFILVLIMTSDWNPNDSVSATLRDTLKYGVVIVGLFFIIKTVWNYFAEQESYEAAAEYERRSNQLASVQQELTDARDKLAKNEDRISDLKKENQALLDKIIRQEFLLNEKDKTSDTPTTPSVIELVVAQAKDLHSLVTIEEKMREEFKDTLETNQKFKQNLENILKAAYMNLHNQSNRN